MTHLIRKVVRLLRSPQAGTQGFRTTGRILAAVLILSAIGTLPAQAALKCPKGQTACGGAVCCNSGQVCCTSGQKAFCAPTGSKCCGNTACGSTQQCCKTSLIPFCAANNRTCCGQKSCGKGDTCCNGTCCEENQTCYHGRCRASRVGPGL